MNESIDQIMGTIRENTLHASIDDADKYLQASASQPEMRVSFKLEKPLPTEEPEHNNALTVIKNIYPRANNNTTIENNRYGETRESNHIIIP
jgi:hypothetical protein